LAIHVYKTAIQLTKLGTTSTLGYLYRHKYPNVMNYRYLTSPCGKDCFNCPMYMGEENRENRDQFFKSRNLPPEKFQCQGCRPHNGYCIGLTILGIDPHCKVYKCVQEHGVEFCYECPNFPCSKLQPVADRADRVPHALKIYNLCMIQKLGVDKWATEHSKRIFNEYYTLKLNDCM
jgi:hypothetical protein